MCNGGNTGAFSYQASGGTGALSYSINGSTFQALPQFTGLAAGTYTLTVRDALNCTAQFSVTLTQPPLLSVNVLDQTNIDCNGNSTGALSFTGSGGAGAYQFSLNGSPFGSQNTFSGLPSGVYNLSVRDGNACTSNLPITLTQPEVLVLGTAGVLNIDCFGNSSGAITLNATGGTQPYQFALSGNPLTTNALFDSLASGTYTFVIRDTNQCADTLVQTLVDPPLLTAQVTDRGNVDCLGNATGVLAVAGSGGTFPYTYALTNGSVQSPFQTDSLFTQLYAGIYTLIVRDLNNCLAEVDTLVTTPSGLAAGVDTTIDVACFGDSTGLLQFVAVGGTAPYSYSFDGVTFSLSNVYPNLPALTDTVLLSDANGCLVPIPVEVLQPPLLTGAIVEQANVACNGDSSARIRLSAAGGTPAYQFSADGLSFVNDSLFQGLPSGAYTFVIRDAQGCLLDLPTNIVQPNPLLLNLLTQKNIDCFGNTNGAISLSASGGVGAYLFALDSAAFGPAASFAGLPAGDYTVTVRDDSLCLTPLNISITQPDSLILTIDQAVDILCFGDSTGLIGLQSSGGSGVYTYSLNGGPFQTAEPFTGLPAGVYSIVLRDDSACVATADTLLSEPPRLVLTLSDSENVDCFGNVNGRIDVSASGGAGGYLFALNGLSPAPDTFFSPLAPGTYFIEVQDLNGCRDSLNRLTITEPPLLELSLLKTDVRCFGNADGSILAIPRGGTPGYRYAWETLPIQTSATATGLPVGTYSVTVSDSNGCTVRGQNTLEQPPLLELFADSIATAFCDFDNGYASVFARGGVPEYTFIWEGTSFTGLVAANITDGTYRVQVTDRQLCTDTLTIVVPGVPPADPLFITDPDAGLPILMMNNDVQFINQSSGAIVYRWDFGDGDLSDEVNPRHVFEEPGEYQVVLTAWNEYLVCPVDYVLTLTLIPDGAIYVANAFTPNGDGVNELFSPIGEGVVQVEWSVYDRWGRRIVTYTSLNERWDGLVRGTPAQEGVYTWVLRATLNSGARVERAGTVTLLR
ncbi:MAG: PKD domain-containing protein [Bacteroidetes bacterium]|nr:MAG: PKD domain-containing protein [Bacteroidota bacterium]